MKGSPFYSGGYDLTVPDAMERRVNLWPFVYYRDPVISLVWPVFEHTEEHLTIRPFFSAYGDTETYTEYSVLWPLCRADLQEEDYRITPYFWGTRKTREGADQDYHVLFPIAWHFENQICTLVPFWLFLHDGWKNGQNTENDYWLCGPLIRFYNSPSRDAWHVTLFYDYRDREREERYCGFPAPLAFSWSNRKNQGLFTPLYAYEKSVNSDIDEGWSVIPPLLACHTWDKLSDDRWLLGPLAHYATGTAAEGGHVTLFGRYRNLTEEATYTGFPWPLLFSWQTRRESGLFTPLYAYQATADGDASEGWSATPALLSWHTWDRFKDERWLLGPLAHHVTGAEREGWHAALFGQYRNLKKETTYTGFPWPLLFSWQTGRDSGLFTPLFVYEEQTKDHAGYSLCPPLLAWHSWRQEADSYWIMGPLGHYEKSPDVDNWHAALIGRYRSLKEGSTHTGMPWPFIFSWQTRQTHGLFTPLYAYQEDNTGTGTAGGSIIPPLLYWHSWAQDDDDTWLFGPLGRYRTGAEAEAWHLGPFGRYRYLKEDCDYAGFPWPLAFSWRTKRSHGLFTPLYAKKETASGIDPGGWAAAPLLLAWKTWTKDESSTWILGPLAHSLTGTDIEGWHAGLFGRYHYLKDDSEYAGFPWPLAFSWRTKGDQGLFTPVYARSETTSGNDPGGWAAAPFLLAWKSWTKDDSDTWILGPLGRYRSGAEVEGWRAALIGRYRYLKEDCDYAGFPWPLAFSWRNKSAHGLFTPVYAYSEKTSANAPEGWAAAPCLLAWKTWQADTEDTCVLAGLYGHHRDSQNQASHLFPLYDYNERDGRFLTPVFGWNRPDANDPDGYWYGFTPLLGGRTGNHYGRWLFPFYSFRGDALDDTYSAYFLLLGRASHSHHLTQNVQSADTSSFFFPIYSHSCSVFTNRIENDQTVTAGFTHRDYRLILNYAWEHQTITQEPTREASPAATNRTGSICRTQRGQGVFPLWFDSSVSEKRLDGTLLRSNADSSLLGLLYDSKSEFSAASGQAKASDYARSRILWRLWQYERRDGDVWVDVFPAITHDTRTDGFRKTSFLWRLYRYERYPEGGVDLDVLFLPLRRAPRAQ